MERKLLRYFLYLVLGFGLIGAIADANPRRSPRGDPTASIVCAVIAGAGLAASVRENRSGA